MTVSYTADVANASRFGCFSQILLKWKGSVYKLIFLELFVYLVCYFIINIIYRTVLVSPGYEYYRHIFEGLMAFCRIQMSSIPMTFGLGFYVSLIVKRWWDQYNLLPWPDSLAIFVVGLIRGLDERGRLMRRNIMRYVLLAYVIVLRRISLRVRKRFPTLEHMVDAGLMREDELKIMEGLNEKSTVSKWWMPLVWATNIVETARHEQRLNNDPGMQTLLGEISAIRKGLTGVQHYDTISVPLVYTQVVTLAVYIYFGAALIGAQWVQFVDPDDYKIAYKLPAFKNMTTGFNDAENPVYQPLDMYIPVFLVLQFVFYVGWLKVAETLINPFGEDDDDFELNYLIDRHVQVSYMIVDDMHQNYPALLKDIHWNTNAETVILPYTQETEKYRKEEPKGSAEIIEEDKDTENNSSTYYKLSFPFRRHSIKPQNSNGLAPPHSMDSEYESIENNMFNKMRAKIRKSQMRKKSGNESDSSIGGYVPRRKMSVDHMRSNRSIYAKMFGSKLWKSMRRTSTGKVVGDNESGNFDPSLPRFKKMSDNSVCSQELYGKLASLNLNEENGGEEENENENGFESNRNAMEQRLRELPHLSTITEQNSPDSTYIRSRSSSRPAILTEETFMPPSFIEASGQQPALPEVPVQNSELESNNYYPLGSDGSSQRPTSPRFTVDEVPNYEPILISKGQIVPPTGVSTSSPSSSSTKLHGSSSTPLAKEVVKREMKRKLTAGSPILPGRAPIMSYKNPLLNSDPNLKEMRRGIFPKAEKQPDIVVTNATDSEHTSPTNGSIASSEDNEEDQNSTNTEELSLEKDNDASSAFDHATFYV